MKTGLRFLSIITILVIATLGLLPGGAALADGETIVSVSAPAEVQPGEQFTINISVEPGEAIAGIQFNLAFDTALLDVDSVAEGNLLSQSGNATYFSPGTIDNTAGTITGVAGAITSPGGSVSSPGTFATITLIAGTQVGTSALTLSNVIVGNISGQPVAVTVINGQVGIGEASGGEDGNDDGGGGTGGGGGGGGGAGGGGGGGGGGSSQAGITGLRNSITSSGSLMEDISATDVDVKMELRIARGTIVLNRSGQPPASIRISSRINSYAVNPGTQLISRLYDIEPSGTTFDPGATLIYRYSNSEIPDGISPENLFLAQWDVNQAQWIELGGAVDTISRTVSVPIQHLSTYAVLAYNGPADFQFSAFTSDVREIYPGESLTFSVLVTNTGDSEGSRDVVLKVDGADAETITVTLGSGESQTVTFNVTPSKAGEHIASIGSLSVPFSVRQELAPSNFRASNLSIYPPEIDLGDSINVSILVTNTGDLPGTYHAVLRVANTEEASADVDLNGGESKNVSFSITPEAIGNYTVTLGGLQAAFVVRTPAPVEPASTVLNINDFQITPTYNPDTDRLVLTKIDYQLEGTQEQLAGTGLMLKVSLDGVFLEEIPILSLNGNFDGNTGSYSYTPSTGWKAGTYSFQAVLYQGDVFLLSSEQKVFIATPEAVAAVFSWNIMAIVIASAMVLAAIIVVLTVLRRRDMLHN